jgi:hypothetical protein
MRMFIPFSFEVTSSYQLMVGFMAFIFVTSGFTLMVIGVGELVERTRHILLSTLFLPVIPIVQVLTGQIWVTVSKLVLILPYLFLTLVVILLYVKTKFDLRLLISGWALLLMINTGFLMDIIDHGLVDLISGLGKVILFWGMTQPSFSFMVDDLREFLVGGIPVEYSDNFNGSFYLINLGQIDREKEISWLKEHIEANERIGIRTVLLSVYDMITPREVLTEDIGDVYFVRLLQGARASIGAFEERVMTIDDDLNQLDILFSDILSFSNLNEIPCEVVLYSLSHLIHTHGWRRVYTFIVSKIQFIKSSKVSLASFYYPSTHEISSDIVKFQTLADRIVSQ